MGAIDSVRAGVVRVATPRFGDTVVNRVASADNPHRVGRFVRVIRRRGRMNPGVWWQVTDGRGAFWETNPDNCDVPGSAETATYAVAALLAKLDELDAKDRGLTFIDTAEVRALLGGGGS